MSDCPCKQKAGQAARRAAETGDPKGTPSLACLHCLDMHLAYALELSYEPASADPLSEERFLLVGTLRAAQDHALALSRRSLACRIREVRKSLDEALPLAIVPPFVRVYLDERRAEALHSDI